MRRAFALLLVAAAGAAFAGRAGSVPAASRHSHGPTRYYAAQPPAPAPADAPACPVPARYRTVFHKASTRSRLPVSLLVSMARVESDLRPSARSSAGARGLLQLMPATARSLAVDAGRDEDNVLGGARYLRQLLDRFGSIDLALAAYNAGPTAVARAGGAPSGETLTYVANVERGWTSIAGCR